MMSNMNNEAAIAERLRQTVPTTPPPATSVPAEPTADEPRGFTDVIGDNTNIYRLYDYFNVETAFRGVEAEQKLETIYRWAADKAQSTDYLAVINVLTAYSQGMGVGSVDKSNLNRMFEYIQLDRQMEQIRQAQGALY